MAIKKWWKKIKSFSAATKVTVPLSVVCILAAAMLLAGILHEDMSVSAVRSQGTEETETCLTELIWEEPETEIETETELPALEVAAYLPRYQSVTMEFASIEKDLTVYLLGSDGKTITGTAFSVKLIAEKDLAQISDAIAAIADTDVSEYDFPDTYDGQPLSMTLEEKQLYKKQQMIYDYAARLCAVDGQTLTDDDKDGIIYEEEMTPGTYVALFVPVEGYDATEYAISVTVKDKIEYKAVTTIQNKVVDEKTAGDPQKTVTKKTVTTEKVASDTVKTAESSSTKTTTDPIGKLTASEVGIVASVSSDVNSVTSSSVPAGTESETTETVASTLSISQSAQLYANSAASFVSLSYSAVNVSGLSMTADDTIASYLTFTKKTNTYTVQLIDPSEVKSNLSGSVTLSGTDAGGSPISVSCSLTVIGADTPIYSANGDAVYFFDDNGDFVAGTVGTYTSSTVYYPKDAVAYFGWQTINGKTYYYDANGKKVTGTQVIGGVTYYFASDGSLITDGTGIDVSKWQGTIDWAKVSTAASFAIIRCGYRGTSGGLAEDPMYEENITNAKKNGVQVGIYFYSIAQTEAQAVEEASLAVSLAKKAGSLDLPIFIDIEDSTLSSLSTSQRDAVVTAFCKTVVNSGYSAGVYASYNWFTTMLTPSKYTNYMIWIARYNTTLGYSGRYEIWQYSQNGTVPGISGYVDMNHGYFQTK